MYGGGEKPALTPLERLERKYERLEEEGKLTPRRLAMIERRYNQLTRKRGFYANTGNKPSQ